MLARIKATQIGGTGLRIAAVLVVSQLTVAAAKVGSHSAHAGNCVGDSGLNVGVALWQTAWGMLNACVVGQLVHEAAILLAPDSSFSAAHTVAGIIGHEVAARIVSFAIQVLS